MNLEQIKSALKAGNYEPVQQLVEANANVLPHGLYRIKNEDIQFMHRNDIFELDELLDILELPIDQIYWLTKNKFWILLSGETTSGFYVFHSEIEPLTNLTIRNGGDFSDEGEFDIPNTLPMQDTQWEDLTDAQRKKMIEHLIAAGYEINDDTSDEEILEYYAERCENCEEYEDEDYEAPDLSDPATRADLVERLIANGYTTNRNLSDKQILELDEEMFEDSDIPDEEEDDAESSVLAFDLGDGTFIVGAID